MIKRKKTWKILEIQFCKSIIGTCCNPSLLNSVIIHKRCWKCFPSSYSIISSYLSFRCFIWYYRTQVVSSLRFDRDKKRFIVTALSTHAEWVAVCNSWSLIQKCGTVRRITDPFRRPIFLSSLMSNSYVTKKKHTHIYLYILYFL